jgi:Domain of unknown function (DUF4282)
VTTSKGLIGALADMTFTSHATPRLIRAFYGLVIAVLVNGTSFWLLLAYALPHWVGWGVKLAIFVIVPLTALTCLVLVRVVLEYLIVVFTIEEKLGVLVEHSTRTKRKERAEE